MKRELFDYCRESDKIARLYLDLPLPSQAPIAKAMFFWSDLSSFR
jgi:hypothetical protein